MRYLQFILVLKLSLSLMTSAVDQEELFIDKGACPGERCTYCDIFTARKVYTVYKAPSKESDEIGEISPDDVFISKSCEVHTLPARFTIFEERGILRPGDDLFILNYLGEGSYRVRHNGELIST